MSIQKSIEGTESSSMARLHPMNVVSSPVVNVPLNAPIELIDPIHESCSLVKGPDFNGEFSDKSVGSDGLSHPSNSPCPKAMMFADGENDTLL